MRSRARVRPKCACRSRRCTASTVSALSAVPSDAVVLMQAVNDEDLGGMYKAAQAQTPPSPGPGASAGPTPGGDGQPKKDEGVIDAEYVDVEEKK